MCSAATAVVRGRGDFLHFFLFFYADGGRWEEAATAPRRPVRFRNPEAGEMNPGREGS